MNAHRDGMFDLGAKFPLGFVGLDVLTAGRGFGPEIAGGVEKAWNFVFGFDRSPAIRSSIRS